MVKGISRYYFVLIGFFLVLFSCGEKSTHKNINQPVERLYSKEENTDEELRKIITSYRFPSLTEMANEHGNISASFFDIPLSNKLDTMSQSDLLSILAVLDYSMAFNTEKKSQKKRSKIKGNIDLVCAQLQMDSIYTGYDADSLFSSHVAFYKSDSLVANQAFLIARTWATNLKLLAFEYKTSNQKEAILSSIKYQLLVGENLLHYLYDYQNDRDIAKFSAQLVEILECSRYELNIDQLKEGLEYV